MKWENGLPNLLYILAKMERAVIDRSFDLSVVILYLCCGLSVISLHISLLKMVLAIYFCLVRLGLLVAFCYIGVYLVCPSFNSSASSCLF